MLDRFASLNVKGSGLIFSDQKVVEVITLASSKMLTEGNNISKLKNNVFEGKMITQFEKKSVGHFCGVVFHACIESKFGQTDLEFILFRPFTEEELRGYSLFLIPSGPSGEIMEKIIEEAIVPRTIN